MQAPPRNEASEHTKRRPALYLALSGPYSIPLGLEAWVWESAVITHYMANSSVTFFLGSDWRRAGALLCSFRDTSFSSRDGGEVGGGEVEGGEVWRWVFAASILPGVEWKRWGCVCVWRERRLFLFLWRECCRETHVPCTTPFVYCMHRMLQVE